ncbi:MAG: hypothetical protein J7J98_03970 [candidate division Zixibacteria bacterium]|nr:hypothetical protein [candidate division Zixibacteria bacterium]
MIISRGLLIAALIALSVSAMAHVCTAEAVSISISDVTCELYESVIVPVTLSGVTNYGTGTINITYNPSVVHVTGVASTPRSTVTSCSIDNATGVVGISAWNIGGVSGDVIFANVTLKSVGPCQSPLNITIAKLRDTGFAVIPATAENGSFTVEGLCPGDVTGDGKITTEDAAIVLQMSVRCEYTQLADLNGDHQVSSLDALMILQEAAR